MYIYPAVGPAQTLMYQTGMQAIKLYESSTAVEAVLLCLLFYSSSI